MKKPHTVVIDNTTIVFRDKKNNILKLVSNELLQKALRYKSKLKSYHGRIVVRIKDLEKT